MAREQYVVGQAKLKKEQAQRQAEKASEKMIEELVWGAPNIGQRTFFRSRSRSDLT